MELLDLPETPDAVRSAAMRDLERSNRWFGGARAAIAAVLPLLAGSREPRRWLDVCTGTADIPARARGRVGAPVVVVGVDRSEALVAQARHRLDAAVVADARALPFRAGSMSVVTCSQAAHHFFDEDLRRLVAELDRVGRDHVVIADLRRSVVATVAFVIGALLFRFHPVTRQDGITSIGRGFTPAELRRLVREVTGVTPAVRRRAFWRLTAAWRPRGDRISAS